jgi:hypothetical protein
MDWQPIETAPKDGTRILLWVLSQYDPREAVGRWDSHGYWAIDYNDVPCDPTHWMPLPAPPKEDVSAAEPAACG